MAFLLSKYRKSFRIFSIAVITVFALSSVSIAYTSVFCKMKRAEAMEMEGCCCKVEDENDKEAIMICSEMSFGNELRFTEEDGCCCEIKTVEATERNTATAVAANTFTNISHEGSLLFELPTPNNIPTLQSILPAGKIVSDGRSVLTLNSVLRI